MHEAQKEALGADARQAGWLEEGDLGAYLEVVVLSLVTPVSLCFLAVVSLAVVLRHTFLPRCAASAWVQSSGTGRRRPGTSETRSPKDTLPPLGLLLSGLWSQ